MTPKNCSMQTIYGTKTIIPLLIIRLYLIDWMIKGTGYQNRQKLKKSIPEYFVKKLKSDDNEKIKKSLGLKIDSNLNIRNHNNKIIVPKELKLKNIQKEIRKPITPKCQFKWDTFYEKKFNFWILIS
jgi:late competence protein required for DNA uptake (superfamily II DNA/RNA helicase)